MSTTLEGVCCARLPALALQVLADLRPEPGITVTPEGDHVWVRWEAGREAVLRRLLPVHGVELYARRDALWYRPGAHLPAFGVPVDLEQGAMPLARAVAPSFLRAIEHDGAGPVPIGLHLVRATTARAATALRCTLVELGRWAERAGTAELAALEAARAGDEVLIRGRRLPAIAGQRYWGDRLLTPLGFRPEPGLPEHALRRALGVAKGDIVLLEFDGFETIPHAALEPLARARVRLARGGPPS
jgi:MoxR-vWA-beta-propeller ternary system domain bpX2